MSSKQAEPQHQYPQQLHAEGISVSLTDQPLDIPTLISSVKSPKAGAVVLFAGTTRDNSSGKRVKSLRYDTYAARALQTMLGIAQGLKAEQSLTAMAMAHRIGVVPIGDESILIAVSSPHRKEAWRAGEQALEACKKSAEIWKLEELYEEDGTVSEVWADGARVGGRCC